MENNDQPIIENMLVIKKEVEVEEQSHSEHQNNVPLDETQFKVENTFDTNNSDSCDNNQFKCQVCLSRFSTERKLSKHFEKRSSPDLHSCCACPKTFPDMARLTIHFRKHTGEKPFVCDACGRGFSIKSNLVKHVRIHTGEKPYECKTCDRKFTQHAHLEDHTKIHTG